MAGFTKHLSTHVYFHMDRTGASSSSSAAAPASSSMTGKKPSGSPRLHGTDSGAAPASRRSRDTATRTRTRSEATEPCIMPSSVAPSRYDPTSADWDEFDYFCQSPYLLSVSEPPPTRERFKRRLFRRSQKYSDPPSAGPGSQRHLDQPPPQMSAERLRCSSRSTETMLDWQQPGSAARRQGSSRRSPAAPASSGSIVPGSQRSLLSDPDEDEFGAADEPASPPAAAAAPAGTAALRATATAAAADARLRHHFLADHGPFPALLRTGRVRKRPVRRLGGQRRHDVAPPVFLGRLGVRGGVRDDQPHRGGLLRERGLHVPRPPSPTTELSPMPRDWIAMQLGRQRQAFAWLQQSSSSRCVLEGLLLMNVERNSQFPFVTYLVCDAARCDPLRLIMQMESHHDAGPEGERLHHTAVYDEVATIARPPVDGVPRKPSSSKTGYILSAFRVFPGEDREKLDRSWLLWTGARQIYRRLPPHLGLRRITFHKKICPQDHGITYVLLCECPTLMDYVSEACVLVDQLRARCCGYTALYRVVDSF
ncbi:LOW QUALITY PROTEIN: uncharacterized protein LOC119463948 [Dermacentor silvarum]|uniref:LOW QUALITY PROTEIN: uncharacterized protein LOC119463948 n=1 Tax=Dermacentor silvarum TaxID=543639 RepID=UPI002100EEEE|nr:LOW QUALITY PROTEIN: uncharacterized protein LOC119463948 [Dermacentor silvarum]